MRGSSFGVGSVLTMTFVALAAVSAALADEAAAVRIPDQSDWTERGVALDAGPEGAWDMRLHGQISPSAMIKRDDTYLLYYVGADGDRSTDGGPRHRALGVATSTDGIRFTRHDANPILTHLPMQNEEEGVFSASAVVDESGHVTLYYGAIWAPNATTESVHSHVALAESPDGIAYENRGYIVQWNDGDVWGHGDELFPVGTFKADDGTWHTYYIAKGHVGSWLLALASGEQPDELPRTQPVLTEGSEIVGGGDVVGLGDGRIALFLVRDFEENLVEVRTASTDNPAELSEPVATYAFDGFRHAVVFLDRETETWFMYQREAEGDRVVVRTAPMQRASDGD